MSRTYSGKCQILNDVIIYLKVIGTLLERGRFNGICLDLVLRGLGTFDYCRLIRSDGWHAFDYASNHKSSP